MKYIKLISLFLTAFVFLSCGGDDGVSSPPSPPKNLTSLKVDYTATVSQHLLDVANVTVRYVGENGQMSSEQMSSPTWSKSVTISLPAKAGMSIQPTLKGIVSDAEYLLSAQGQMSYSWLDQDGKQLKAGLTETTPALEARFYADGLGQYLGAIAANCQLARTFANDYTVSETTVTWGGNADENSTQSTGISDEGATNDNR